MRVIIMQNVFNLALTNHLAYCGIIIITISTATEKSQTVVRPVFDKMAAFVTQVNRLWLSRTITSRFLYHGFACHEALHEFVVKIKLISCAIAGVLMFRLSFDRM